MAPPGRRAAVAADHGSLRSLAEQIRLKLPEQIRLKLPERRRPHDTRASFDPVRVEAELYDALYGSRTGTVENVAPVSSEIAPEAQLSVGDATSAQSTSGDRHEKRRRASDTHERHLRHAA
jgi:hypothetical protein